MINRIEEYLDYLKNDRNLSPATILTARYELLKWSALNGNISRYMSRVIAPQTKNRNRGILLSYYNYLVTKGYSKSNPIINVTLAKTSTVTKKFLAPQELLSIIDGISGTDFESLRNRAIFEIGVCIASRTGDFKELKLTDLDLINKTIKVFGKGRKESYQILTDRCIEHINKYLIERLKIAKCDYLFITELGEHLKHVYPVFHKYLKGIINPHAFTRHSVAIAMLREGADIANIRDLLRHTNISTTSSYLLVDKNTLRTTINNTHPIR